MDWSVPVQCLQDMPNHYSPIKKLERLLASVNSIYTIVRGMVLESHIVILIVVIKENLKFK